MNRTSRPNYNALPKKLMAENNHTESSNYASELTSTSDYISHHLTNLTYGWCEKSQSWGYANHQQSLFEETPCKVSEMGFWTLHVDTIVMSSLLGTVFFGFFGLVLMGAKKGVPGKVQNFAEFVFEFISNAVKTNFHGTSKILGPLAFTACVWILSWNLMDLLPVELTNFVGNAGVGIDYFKLLPTADVNGPLALAIVVMFFVTYYTIATHGIGGFLKEFINPIELVGYFSKHVALALRLYGNLFAGEMIFILIGIMFGQFFMSFGQTLWFIPGLMMNLVWALFHILIIALQAYIFMMLTIAYINLACAKH